MPEARDFHIYPYIRFHFAILYFPAKSAQSTRENMLSRRASETESTQVQERVERANAPPGEHSMASLPDPGEWNADTSNDAEYQQEEEQEEGYYDQEEGQYDDQHQYHDDGDDGQYYQDDDRQYQYEDDAEYQQEQQQQHYDYDEDAPPYEEDIPAPEPKQQRGVRFRSILKQEKQSSDTNNKMGRKQISAYNLFGLSRVSAAYDSGNKGYLTAAEQKLREMDKANVGSLNNAQVAQLMEQKLREDEIIKRQRRLLYVLGCMTVLLMVSNLGTAWAAAILAKDTAVDMASGELRINGGGGDEEGSGSAVVVTRAMGDSFLFYNFNASSTVLMNHHLESEQVEEEEGDSMVPVGTGTTGTVGGDDNSAIADAEGDASTTSDLLVPGTEEEEEEEVNDDDSLFCISPKQAAKLWHETSTGTPVTAFFDYSPPTTDADASPPPEVHSLTLNADGALMNATHACLHTGLPSDAAGPQYVCIDFANTNCDVEISRQQQEASDGAALSGANDGTSSSDQRAAASQNVFQGQDDGGTHGGDDHPDHVHGRRILFETALREIRDPNSVDTAMRRSPSPLRSNNLRGTSSEEAISASTQSRRIRRKRNKNVNNNQNPNRKNKKKKNNKKIFDMEIPADMCIMIPMATNAAVHRPIPGGPQQVASVTPAEVMGDYMATYHGNDSF